MARVQSSGRVLTWGWRGCTCCPRRTSSTKDRDGFLWAAAARGQPSVVEGMEPHGHEAPLSSPQHAMFRWFCSRSIEYSNPKRYFYRPVRTPEFRRPPASLSPTGTDRTNSVSYWGHKGGAKSVDARLQIHRGYRGKKNYPAEFGLVLEEPEK